MSSIETPSPSPFPDSEVNKVDTSSNPPGGDISVGQATDILNGMIPDTGKSWGLDKYEEPLKRAAERLIATGDSAAIGHALEVVRDNSIDGTPLTPLMGPWGIGSLENKKAKLLKIYEKAPDAAIFMVHHHVAGFHGSLSGSLVGVLKQRALLPEKEARSRGQMLATGERTFSPQEGQEMVSFADWLYPRSIAKYSSAYGNSPNTLGSLRDRYKEYSQVAKAYNRLKGPTNPITYNIARKAADLRSQIDFIRANPNSEEARLMLDNFPVAYGVSIEGADIYTWVSEIPKDKTDGSIVTTFDSHIPGEFIYIGKELGIDKIPIVAVPADRIDQVRALFEKHKLDVKVIDIAVIV